LPADFDRTLQYERGMMMKSGQITRLRQVEERIQLAIPDKETEEHLQKMRLASIRHGLRAYGYDLNNSELLSALADHVANMKAPLSKASEAIREIIRENSK
jgi:hypothetical protein